MRSMPNASWRRSPSGRDRRSVVGGSFIGVRKTPLSRSRSRLRFGRNIALSGMFPLNPTLAEMGPGNRTQSALDNLLPAEIYDCPMRDLRDVEALERVPLEQRIFSWNANDWIVRGCQRDPDKIALTYIADGNPEGP